ncbi:hypothetical protein [Halorussus salinisoli]|uniref:hypothetical protein n=1 Tax=Halorussus salinisoli TaxID=2558242 RepID=UPI0010C2043D|nr:hypothetical protein [Halorussus salinisoli]
MTRDSNDSTLDAREGIPSLADDALLAPFRETDDPVLTTEEVRDTVSFGRIPTAEELERLASEGVLERKSVGDETVWWLPGHTGTDERSGPRPGTAYKYEGGLSRQLENEISTLSAPNERERAAIYATCYYVSEYGPATPETLREEVYPTYPAGHDDAETWWNTCIRPALAALSSVERDDGEWRIDRKRTD